MAIRSSTYLTIIAFLAFVILASIIVPQVAAINNPKVGSVSVVAEKLKKNIAGQSATYVVTVDRGSGGGSSGAFTAVMSISGLPEGASGSFSPAIVSFTSTDPTMTTLLTITTLGSLPGGSYSFTVTATRSDNAQDLATDGDLNILLVTAVPEYAFGGLAALGACFVGFAVIKKRISLPHFKQL